MKYLPLFLFLPLILLAQPSPGQVTADEIYIVTLNSGEIVKGNIVAESEGKITLQSVSGLTLEIPRTAIATMELFHGKMKEGKLYRSDPNYSRLMFAPTARPLKKGDGYFSDYYIIFPGVSYGFTRNLTVMAGFTIIPGLGLKDQVKYIGPKFSLVNTEKYSVAIGTIYGAVSGEFGGGISYVVGTFGSPDKSVTTGLGFGFMKAKNKKFEFAERPVIMLGGNFRLSNSLALVTENWLFPWEEFDLDYQPFSVALRLFGDRMAVDFGAILMPVIFKEGGFPFPWLSFVYNFSRK